MSSWRLCITHDNVSMMDKTSISVRSKRSTLKLTPYLWQCYGIEQTHGIWEPIVEPLFLDYQSPCVLAGSWIMWQYPGYLVIYISMLQQESICKVHLDTLPDLSPLCSNSTPCFLARLIMDDGILQHWETLIWFTDGFTVMASSERIFSSCSSPSSATPNLPSLSFWCNVSSRFQAWVNGAIHVADPIERIKLSMYSTPKSLRKCSSAWSMLLSVSFWSRMKSFAISQC